MSDPRSEVDFAIEFGRYLAFAAEKFIADLDDASGTCRDPDPDFRRALESAIHEFRKRADRADKVTALVRRLVSQQRLREWQG
jgi:hypothetical protein